MQKQKGLHPCQVWDLNLPPEYGVMFDIIDFCAIGTSLVKAVHDATNSLKQSQKWLSLFIKVFN